MPFVLSANSNGSLEEAAAVAPEHTWFQLYGLKDSAITADKVRRAADAGIKALVLSVDVPVSANRERNRRNGFFLPLRITPSIVFQALMHPAWTMEYLHHSGLPPMKNYSPYAPQGAGAAAVSELFASLFPAPALTWSLLDDVRRLWPCKLFVKGIMRPEDVRRAVSAGADGIMVSNHGARQLDRAPAPIDVLPAIRAAVGDRAEITLDRGVRRGPTSSRRFVSARTPSLLVGLPSTARWWAAPPELRRFSISLLLSWRWCSGKWAVRARRTLVRTSL